MSDIIRQDVLPSAETDLDSIRKVMAEICNAYSRIEGEKDYIKDAIGGLNEKYGISKANLNKIAKWHHQNKLEQEKNKTEEAFYLYEGIFQK